MIKSMTGFGRCEIVENNRKVTVEMKSVNHKFFDLSVKLPKKFNFFEPAIRNHIKKYAGRGKIDVFISYEDMNESRVSLNYNHELAKEYLEKFMRIEAEFKVPNDLKVTSFLRCPEVFSMEEQSLDEEELWQLLEKTISGAAERFVESRTLEGEHLKKDLLDKLRVVEDHVSFLEERSPEIISEYRNRIEIKVKELLENPQIDENRILTEVVLFADKISIDEEIVRLKSHIKTMADTLSASEPIGRKLDFITQEMNREANTILSKANDLLISNKGIDLKTDIEKVREQIQNIE
jgi:uncharacterized protein (TIGR00255 family)